MILSVYVTARKFELHQMESYRISNIQFHIGISDISESIQTVRGYNNWQEQLLLGASCHCA